MRVCWRSFSPPLPMRFPRSSYMRPSASVQPTRWFSPIAPHPQTSSIFGSKSLLRIARSTISPSLSRRTNCVSFRTNTSVLPVSPLTKSSTAKHSTRQKMDTAHNELLTRIGPGAAMGNLLRHYWMPVAGASEFSENRVKAVRLLGEDLVLYKDLKGVFGLVQRSCAHRRADLAHGFVEKCGLRCNYHGWASVSY